MRSNQARYESFVLRISFLFAGQFALYEGFQDWNRGRADVNPGVAVATLIIYAVSLLIIALALTSNATVFRFRDLPLLPLVLTTIVSVYVVAEIAYNGSYRTDVLAFSHYAAILATRGLNPYTQDMTPALSMFAVQPSDLTPLTTGSYLVPAPFQYPALQFLVFVPFVAVGLRDMRWVLLIFELAIIAVLYIKCPKNLRPMLILPLFAGSDLMINYTAASVSDIVWVLPILLTAFTIDRKLALSGIFYGIACAIKQPPWLLAPFLIIYMMKETGPKETYLQRTATFFGPALGVFVLANLPFAYADPGGWLRDILTPILSNFVSLSQGGPAVLSEVGLVHAQPMFYSLLAGGVLIVLMANYFVYYSKLRFAMWIFPGLVLWFSYRALTSYIIYWMPLMLAALLLWYRSTESTQFRGRRN